MMGLLYSYDEVIHDRMINIRMLLENLQSTENNSNLNVNNAQKF